jgi:hypothetical protein
LIDSDPAIGMDVTRTIDQVPSAGGIDSGNGPGLGDLPRPKENP